SHRQGSRSHGPATACISPRRRSGFENRSSKQHTPREEGLTTRPPQAVGGPRERQPPVSVASYVTRSIHHRAPQRGQKASTPGSPAKSSSARDANISRRARAILD